MSISLRPISIYKSYNIYTIFISTILVLYNLTTKAQKTLNKPIILTPEKGIEILLKKNYDIQINYLDTLYQKEKLKEQKTYYYPSLNINSSNSYQNTSTVTDFENNQRPRNEIIGADNILYGVNLQVNYTLFDGFKRKYNYKKLYQNYKVSKLQVQETIQNVSLEFYQYYLELNKLLQQKKIILETIKVQEKQLEKQKITFKYGQNNKTPSLIQELNIENNQIQLEKVKHNITRIETSIRTLLNIDDDQLFSTTKISIVNPLELKEETKNYLDQNPRIKQLQEQQRSLSFDQKIIKSGYLPQISIQSSYGWNARHNSASAFFPATFSRSWTGIGSINFNWSIYNHRRKQRQLYGQKILEDKFILEKEKLVKKITKNYKNLWLNHKLIEKEQNILESKIKLQEDILRRYYAQYKIGKISFQEIERLETSLLQNKLEKSNLIYQLKNIQLEILAISGKVI